MEVNVTSRLKSVLFGAIGSFTLASLAQAQPAPEPAPAAEPPAAAEPPPAAEITPPPAAPPPAADPPPLATPEPPPAALAPNPPPAGATAPTAFKIEAANGSSLKLGVLLQPQFSAVGDFTRDSMAMNLFIRRTRILIGGSLFGTVEYFLDTDYPNLFLANSSPTPPTAESSPKNTPGMNIQDAFLTYKAVGDAFKIDAGYMLPPMSHNAVQGAGTLYSWDYFAGTFQHSTAFGSSGNPVGRDAGLQLRGLVLDNHLEYRVGLFQGLRDGQTADEVGANNMFRTTGRLQVNVFDAETGFFYAGSYLGSKTVLSFGAAFDIQDDYKYFAGDAFADLPVGGNVVTAQVNVAHWDGGDFLTTLPKQTLIAGEAGFHISDLHLAPILRFEKLMYADGEDGAPPPPLDPTRLGIGLAYFPSGHNLNIKAFYTHNTIEDGDHAAKQFNLQGQLYVF
jgi:hypothetical protein